MDRNGKPARLRLLRFIELCTFFALSGPSKWLPGRRRRYQLVPRGGFCVDSDACTSRRPGEVICAFTRTDLKLGRKDEQLNIKLELAFDLIDEKVLVEMSL